MSSSWDPFIILYALIVLITIHYVLKWTRSSGFRLHNIPAVGSSSFFLSYYYALQNRYDTRQMIQEGYDKYRGSVFRIPLLFRWEVIVTGPKLLDEYRKAGDDELSLPEAIVEHLQIHHTLGSDVHNDPYHVSVIQTRLTRNLSSLFADIRDELSTAFRDFVPPTQEWTKVAALPTIMRIISRTSNRIFVGLPVCRDSDFCELNIQFTLDVFQGAENLKLYPPFLRPVAKYLVTNVPSSVARGVKHLKSIIEERYRLIEEHGKHWEGKPNDMLMWLMEEATGNQKTVEALVVRILAVNFAAIHTSSISFGGALFRLASHPEYIAPMRAEVEAVIASDGWTRLALQKMRKVDSFLRECQRMDGLGSTSMPRRAMKDFQFSDGTFIPKGTYLSLPALSTHTDSEYYEEPGVFNPWRFSDIREGEGEKLKHQMVSTSSHYLAFGHGKHACPGRFFAANELKCMMAHLVLNYDVKMEQEGVMPVPDALMFTISPNPKAEVLFRKRQDS